MASTLDESQHVFAQLPDADDSPRKSTSLGGAVGGKTIGWFGSWALTVNNITGPGMLYLAAVFQGSGLVVPILAFIAICLTSTGASTLLCDAIARMPGNKDLNKRYEYSDAFRHYFGHGGFVASQAMFFMAIFTQAVASIVATAQASDGLLVQMFGASWGLQITPSLSFVTWSPEIYCGDLVNRSKCIPFSTVGGSEASDIGSIISAGYILSIALMMPLGFLNLDDNIKFQILSFFVLVILSLEFMADMLSRGDIDPSRLSLWGRGEFSTVVGTLMFNFAYCPTIPSWLNEKKRDVRAAPVLWGAAVSAVVMYIGLGTVSAMCFENAKGDLLQALSAGKSWPLTKVCAFLFGILVIGPGIPVFCIVMRYNLLVGKVCGPRMSSFWGVVFPWLVSWPLYQGTAAATFIAQSGTVLLSIVGFLAPLVLGLAATGGLSLRGMWARAGHLQRSAAPALPDAWLPQQQRFASALICLIIPLIMASLYSQL